MGQVISRVQVEDFDRFFETFSTRGAAKRAEYGCRGTTVYRVAGDEHAVVNVFDWDRADVERFMADAEVPAIMEAAGLRHRPEFTWVEETARLES